jgi:c-di-GMP-binding flagellar brake protein YcgR
MTPEAALLEKRRYRRYPLELQLEVTKFGSEARKLSAQTKNISRGGVLFVSEKPLELGSAIEFFVNFPDEMTPTARVGMRCKGRVIRTEKEVSRDPRDPGLFMVAATMERCEINRKEIPTTSDN